MPLDRVIIRLRQTERATQRKRENHKPNENMTTYRKITIRASKGKYRVYLNGKHIIGTSVYPHMSAEDIVRNIYGEIYDTHMTEGPDTPDEYRLGMNNGDEIHFAGKRLRFTESHAKRKSILIRPFLFRVAYDGTGHIEVLRNEN